MTGTHDPQLTVRIHSMETEMKALRKNFARYLAPAYLENPVEIARICDEEIDRTGKLLGYVREAATEAKRSL
jgi:hypothetical protein